MLSLKVTLMMEFITHNYRAQQLKNSCCHLWNPEASKVLSLEHLCGLNLPIIIWARCLNFSSFLLKMCWLAGWLDGWMDEEIPTDTKVIAKDDGLWMNRDTYISITAKKINLTRLKTSLKNISLAILIWTWAWSMTKPQKHGAGRKRRETRQGKNGDG